MNLVTGKAYVNPPQRGMNRQTDALPNTILCTFKDKHPKP